LDDIQKKLEDYLENKRAAFPRFYFLSNDELLEILANSQNLDVIQQHLKTCFDNLVKLEINELDIVAMFSNEGEKVPFNKV
jgi:dynein heavy chain